MANWCNLRYVSLCLTYFTKVVIASYLFPLIYFAVAAVFNTLIPPTPPDNNEAADFGLNETSGSVSSPLVEPSSPSLN